MAFTTPIGLTGMPTIYNVRFPVGPNMPNVRDDVMLVQMLMKFANFVRFSPGFGPVEASRNITIDGIFGPQTKRMITAFEADRKSAGIFLVADGIVESAPKDGFTKGGMLYKIVHSIAARRTTVSFATRTCHSIPIHPPFFARLSRPVPPLRRTRGPRFETLLPETERTNRRRTIRRTMVRRSGMAERILRSLAMALLLASVGSSGVLAAELKVFSTGAFKEALRGLAPVFEKSRGHTVVAIEGTTDEIIQQMAAGGRVDVVIAPVPLIDQMVRRNVLVTASAMPVAKSGIGVAARVGVPKFDISTTEAFKKTLLEARSIVLSAGVSGIYLNGLFRKWGIDNQIASKSVTLPARYRLQARSYGVRAISASCRFRNCCRSREFNSWVRYHPTSRK